MRNIDKQALRQLATDAHELGIIKRYTKGIEANKRFAAIATPLTFLALLDELEAAKQDSARWFKAFEKAVSIGARYEERIAELEARTVKLPTGTEINGFQMLIESEVIALLREAGINVIVVRAAGIGVKGE
ncbi:ead/Ea22-like family protein [Citrobacter sp. Cy230]|uniref:ead/Ea22-like family protein n=1 Tax=Citrobacter sp. Cy230 TaxID=2985163 RepID=UPI002577187A|nr:ead/Ea22-like family protein [Citrobacter sp. Cy230]MDM2723497.1 ead/Ea22-like family protein [Citrobacter sp. Cy230]